MYFKLFIFVVIIISAIFHEYAHGMVAYKLGDDTAKRAGRLTLNPIAHMELFGTIILPLLSMLGAGIFVGWAKPVPYNPYNLVGKKRAELKIALAGPMTNFLIAIIFGIIIRIFGSLGLLSPIAVDLFSLAIYINIFLALFNLIPLHPLDGSKILMDIFPGYARSLMSVGMWGIIFAIILAFYVLPPIALTLFKIITGFSLF